MVVLILLKRTIAILSPVPPAVEVAPNAPVGGDIEIGPMAVFFMETAIHVPAQAQVKRQATAHLEIVRGEQRHVLAASIQSRRYALRTIVHLPKHEVGEGEAHERQHRGIVRREGLVPKVVSPDAPVIQAVDAAGLKVAAELEIVSSAHP